ncbi:hypothetical protein [Reyranella soli]|uniref:Uncharacterized protein n=1 Tax=Reyranella soli TaxID=1230389 RepID=A0A512N7E1_9HYPH|nr:hypothetical protein [Reyranella soli]GEP54898.1 hypothetical protein RSO01_20640 [Reyranella soli]
MFKFAVAAMSLSIAFTASALADSAAGNACAANLTPDGQSIYTTTMAAKPTTQNQRDVLEKETRSLAMNNKIARGSARDNAIAAEACIKAALQ